MMEGFDPVLERMRRQVRRWEKEEDARAIFLGCYSMMTENMLQALDQGRFRDGVWVDGLLHRFADYYFDALTCYDCDDPTVPRAWHVVHSATTHQSMHVLQHLLLGVNAHINYDLVLTLYDMLQPEWSALDGASRARRLEDHLTVNQVIAETVDRVQDEVVERQDPVMELVDVVMGRLDERFFAALITSWRHRVWDRAQAMLATGSESERESLRRQIEDEVLRMGRFITLDHPS